MGIFNAFPLRGRWIFGAFSAEKTNEVYDARVAVALCRALRDILAERGREKRGAKRCVIAIIF